jgi:hypothetical protein
VITPDVVADFSRVRVTELAPTASHWTAQTGDQALLFDRFRDGRIGEGQIAYAGAGAVAGALAARIERLAASASPATTSARR